MEKITSKNNDLIKSVKKLLASSKERNEKQQFVLEGARLVFDALNSLYSIKYFFITESAFQKYKDLAHAMLERAEISYLISDDVSAKLSETKNSQGVFAVCKMKNNSRSFNKADKLIALDNVQDPGNLGTIIRTAEALGINAVIIGGGCDLYNPKVLRSSMGSSLRINTLSTDNLKGELLSLKDKGLSLYATVADNEAFSITDVDFSNGGVCVIGNEANGVSADIKEICDSLITIRMLGNAESLNACVAASITMWEMLR